MAKPEMRRSQTIVESSEIVEDTMSNSSGACVGLIPFHTRARAREI